MVTETLSQNEIDSLLGSGSQRSAPTHADSGMEVQVYDFRRPHRVSKERLRALEALYGRLAKSLEGWLVGRIRGQLELSLLSVEQLSFGEFLLSLPSPCASYIFDVADSAGQQGVIDFGHELCYVLVDRMLGGSGTPTVLTRGMTTIEREVVRTAAERLTAMLAEAWQDHVPLSLGVSGFESLPEILQSSNREDPVLVATLQVNALGVSSMILVTLPFAVLEKFFATSGRKRVSAAAQSDKDRLANRDLAARLLRSAKVPVAARLPECRLSMRNLGSLRIGTVLSTGIPCDSQIQVFVGTQPRFKATHGKIGSRLAVSLLDSLLTSPDAGETIASSDDSLTRATTDALS